MVKSAKDKKINNPWGKVPTTFELWADWWEGKIRARGQVPSEMFLWYLVTANRQSLNMLLAAPQQMKHLPIVFRGSTEEALDVYCAQLRWTDEHGGVEVFPTGASLDLAFEGFVTWIQAILSRGIPGVSVDKYKQVALLIAALVEQHASPGNLSQETWDALAEFIRTPRQAGKKWLKDGYPEQKGRWGGDNGQFEQCERACELVREILRQQAGSTV